MANPEVVKLLKEGLAYFSHDPQPQKGDDEMRCDKCGEWEGELGGDFSGACIYERAEVKQWFVDRLKEAGADESAL